MSEIINIRRDDAGRRLRKTWKELLTKACADGEIRANIDSFREVKGNLINLFKKQYQIQENGYRRTSKYAKISEETSWWSGGISLLAGFINPLLGVGTGVFSWIAGKPAPTIIRKSTKNMELVILALRIQHKL